MCERSFRAAFRLVTICKVLILWCTRRDSNARPLPSEGVCTVNVPAKFSECSLFCPRNGKLIKPYLGRAPETSSVCSNFWTLTVATVHPTATDKTHGYFHNLDLHHPDPEAPGPCPECSNTGYVKIGTELSASIEYRCPSCSAEDRLHANPICNRKPRRDVNQTARKT